MFVLGNFLSALAEVLDLLLSLYMWVIIIAALLSWVNPDPYNPIVRFLYRATEPVFAYIRRLLPISAGGIDFSPMIALFIIIFLRQFLVKTIFQIALRLG